MNRRTFHHLLTAVIIGSLCVAASSCKDSDDNQSEQQPSGQSESESGDAYDLQEAMLASIVCQWTDEQANDLEGNWRAESYEVTIGEVMDESKPLVRAYAVGTLEAADAYAATCFRLAGINPEHPDGYVFNAGEYGSVSYRHGGGDANVLATIDVHLRQLPGMSQLQLVKTLPTNSGVQHARYQLGDVISRDEKLPPKMKETMRRYYICVTNHGYGGQARFVSMNSNATHYPGDCGWGSYADSCFKAKEMMATDEGVAMWLKNIVLDDANYEYMLDMLKNDANMKDAQLHQLIPESQEIRKWLVQMLYAPENVTPDLNKEDRFGVFNKHKFIMPYLYTWEKTNNAYLIGVRDRILVNAQRWNGSTTNDYWEPYIIIIPNERYEKFTSIMNATASQTEYGDWFRWARLMTGSLNSSKLTGGDVKEGRYHICLVGMHWTHEEFTDDNGNSRKMIFHFRHDWTKHVDDDVELKVKEKQGHWGWQCIATSEISFFDKGTATTKYKEEWVQSQH